jgi:broad specificity phosphatase PhoE
MEIKRRITILEEFSQIIRNELKLENWKRLEENLILIRHGRTQWNKEQRLQGSSDYGILDEEREKLQADSVQIKSLVPKNSIIISSNLRRAIETAEIYSQTLGLKIIENPLFREFNFGEWEGKRIEELISNPDHEFFLKKPITASLINIPPNGEKFMFFLSRIYQGTKQLLDFNTPIILVNHALTIRAIRFIGLIINEPNKQIDEEEFFFNNGLFLRIPHYPIKIEGREIYRPEAPSE